MEHFKLITFSHKTTDISAIGKLHIDPLKRKERLANLFNLGITELLYLSTCNRVEFLLVDDQKLNKDRLKSFFGLFNPNWSSDDVEWAIQNSTVHYGFAAVEHLFRVASSLDSLVIGEREIITQVRKAYDESNEFGFTGHYIRLLVNKTIECAKSVYTNTNIAKNPVSIVSLAYRTLKELNLKEDSRILVVGAGETNTTMCKFLFKHGFKNFTVVNRTYEKAMVLAAQVKGTAMSLSELPTFSQGFDLLVTCTGSENPIFTKTVYDQLLMGESNKKTIIDLAIPTDVDAQIVKDYSVNYIEINSLKKVSDKNLLEREKEIKKCEFYIGQNLESFDAAFFERKVELAMSEIPEKVKEIKHIALSQVFAKELMEMDESSRVVVDKMLAYMEKKYISVPMKMAKEILLKKP